MKRVLLDWVHGVRGLIGRCFRDSSCSTKSCSLYKRDGYYYLVADSLATDGYGIHDGEVIRLPVDCSCAGIGQAAKDCYGRNRSGIPCDPTMDILSIPYAAGLKGWSSFYKDAMYVSVQLSETVRIVPYCPIGKGRGFVPRDDLAIECGTVVTAEELGEHIVQAFVVAAELPPVK